MDKVLSKEDDFKDMPKGVLKTLELEMTKNGGFVIWATEEYPNGKKNRHWLLDGCMFKKDGEIRLGKVENGYKQNVVFKGTRFNPKLKFVIKK